jgi:hypothetical protein
MQSKRGIRNFFHQPLTILNSGLLATYFFPFHPGLGRVIRFGVDLIFPIPLKKTIILFFESTLFALGALKANLLRTLLSLLGVTVGIFAIIAVFTLVDSLELSIRQSMSFFGDRVLYVQKWPWVFENSYPWYRYVNRPVSSMSDFAQNKEYTMLVS